jgi:glycosyltransferase involved in cell wall biosynthesis
MKLAICTIQRNRAPWLAEWFAFHAHFGVDQFYFFAHKCNDDTDHKILELQQKFNIKAFNIPDETERPQLAAYKWAYENFNHEFDWIAFIDGDEFLYPTNLGNLKKTLEEFNYLNLSALGVYWRCFGSSGHIAEPKGRIIENYVHRAADDFHPNRHIKSIVRGRQGRYFDIVSNAHVFSTINGTFDEQLRAISNGLTDNTPSYQKLVINHYAVQSREFYTTFKKFSGAADAGAQLVRSEEWWTMYDRNEVYDSTLLPIAQTL